MPTLKETIANLRIIPRNSDFLDRKYGSRGEIYFDQDSNTIRIYDGITQGGIELLRADLENLTAQISSVVLGENPPSGVDPGTIWFNTSTGQIFIFYSDGTSSQWVQPSTSVIGGGGGGGATAINDLTDVIVTSPSTGQVLKYNGTNWVNDTDITSGGSVNLDGLADVTISDVSTGQSLVYSNNQWVNQNINVFSTIAVTGQNSVIADSTNDTLTLVAGTGINISTNSTNDSITISTSTASSFSSLSEVISSALTIDKIYLPAITMLIVTNNLSSSYRFDQYGSSNNPTIYAISGTTIAFNLNVTGHPFQIQDATGANYNNGLTHISTTGVVSTGSSAQGKTTGTLYWKIPESLSGGYRYQCSVHGAMVGSILIKSISVI